MQDRSVLSAKVSYNYEATVVKNSMRNNLFVVQYKTIKSLINYVKNQNHQAYGFNVRHLLNFQRILCISRKINNKKFWNDMKKCNKKTGVINEQRTS